RAEISSEERMLWIDLIIDFAHAVLRAEAVERTEMDSPAFILSGAVAISQHLQSRLAQLAPRNGVIHERRSQSDLPSVVARGRGDFGEVPCKHCRRRNVVGTRYGSGPLDRELCSPEEKELVVDDGAADRSAELISLERIANRREEIAGVEC